MSRYLGSVCKLCRREQMKLFLKGDKCYTKCVFEKRSSTPGMAKPQRGKPSEYAIRLREKQRLRRMVAINEVPFSRVVEKASKSPLATGDEILRSLEMRLDNVTRRLGLATSLKTARQLVLHNHIKVAGKIVNIPSYAVRPGDVISLSPRLKDNVGVKLSLDSAKRQGNRPVYLEFNEAEFSGKVMRVPERGEMAFPITEQLIIEYYSK